MNKHSSGIAPLLVLALLAVPSLSAGAQLDPGWSAVQHEVWKTVVAWNDAFARNDPEAYFKFIDPDVTVIFAGNPYRVAGIADDREEFEFALNKGFSRVGYFQELDPHIAVFGDAAVVTYYSRGYYGTEQGATAYYKETDVLVKRAAAWKIVHIHVSNAK